jgi:hypothetical protein
MSLITLHPTLGLNPRLTYCTRCGRDGPDLMLLGNRNWKRKCASCGCINYGASAKDDCGSCGVKLWNSERIELEEREKLPGSLCNDCQKEVDQHAAIVAEGGIYWKCRDCKKGGVIWGSSELAKRVREKMGVEPPKPCGVEFTKAEGCPACGGENAD